MALTAKNIPYKEGFGPFANEIYRMPMPYSFHYEGNLATMAQDYLEIVTSKIEKEVGAHNVAAIIIEPIQGEGGFIVPPKGFLPGLSKFATEKGIVFIADEVQTGFARTGNMFACEDEGVVPDMIVTAKGIAGGLPLAAVNCARRYYGFITCWWPWRNIRRKPNRVRGSSWRNCNNRRRETCRSRKAHRQNS